MEIHRLCGLNRGRAPLTAYFFTLTLIFYRMDSQDLFNFRSAIRQISGQDESEILDKDARLLACFYCYLVNEPIGENLYCAIKLAQDSLNIKGGESPNPEGVDLFNKYRKELIAAHNAGTPCEWAKEICKKYGMEVCMKQLAIMA